MFIIKTKLDKSSISGIGLFANQFVAKNEIVWQITSISVLKIDSEHYTKLSILEKNFIEEKDYYWLDENRCYMIPIDDSRFVNHSNDPNIIEKDDGYYVALHDIHPNEEITIDYKTLVPQDLWQPYML